MEFDYYKSDSLTIKFLTFFVFLLILAFAVLYFGSKYCPVYKEKCIFYKTLKNCLKKDSAGFKACPLLSESKKPAPGTEGCGKIKTNIYHPEGSVSSNAGDSLKTNLPPPSDVQSAKKNENPIPAVTESLVDINEKNSKITDSAT